MKSGGRSRYEARCAGTAGNARIKVSAGHVGWADVTFCMEKQHGFLAVLSG
jgi:predicted protein tyrosine phosphatase